MTFYLNFVFTCILLIYLFIYKLDIWPSANKDSYCWGQDIPNNNFKSIEYIRLSLCIFKIIGPEENMLKISWQSGVPSRSYQQ